MIDMAWWTVGWLLTATMIGASWLTVRMLAFAIREIRRRRACAKDAPTARVVRR